MKSNRSFVRKGKNLEIKKIVEQDNMPTLENGRISIATHADKGYQVFIEDLRSIIDKRTCAFIRPYIPGEFEGFKLPNGLDLSEITHTFIVIGDPESHVENHLMPLGTTFKAVCFTIEEGMPTVARVPLLPEQVLVLNEAGEGIMEIEKILINGYEGIKFIDRTKSTCYICLLRDGKVLQLDLDEDFCQFTQDEIKTLLPYLQAFAETGTLEPATESPLQGDEERIEEQKKQIEALEKEKAYCLRQLDKQVDQIADLEEQLTTMQEAGVAMAANIVNQGKRIEALQNLVREWVTTVGENEFQGLQEQTAQLLGEESAE